ncbi:hypothetical protein BGW36DRAFT_424789 [Talaromyces proteolyticus]|uniref:Xylanolytic transcriptional activator regulatory domain-containing protein n=1 Tax=Talaromyces proteolyticus TaxID=1131652 RepID=A0AAD4Q4A2_9EURO|nr:uncharacterized protein BGW36DRAFT_424789 [Talaromyces proteolyticus]KAH8702516.1 hypothetical protein BGW36DRAFT_424789 [Talaromyces proteolyticus]
MSNRFITPPENVRETLNCPPSRATNIGDISSITLPVEDQQLETYSSELYVDLLLEDKRTTERRRNESLIFKAHDQYIGSSGIAFFSDQRLVSISDRLGHRKLRDLLENIANSVNSRINCNTHLPAPIKFVEPSTTLQISEASAKLYITAYFENVHPVYPFIDRHWFEERAHSRDIALLLRDMLPFSALYHAILALGAQYHGDGSFEPGTGISWKLYQIALGLFPEILAAKESLVNVQAVTAMAIFAHNSSCIQIGHMLTAEAARMAQSLNLHRAISDNENVSFCQRTFWVIYFLEKTLSFACGKSSSIHDCDIGTPIPDTPKSVSGSFDWLRTICRFSRLVSKAYTTLFSISATLLPMASIRATIISFNCKLESWRLSVPEAFRPGNSLRSFNKLDNPSNMIFLRVHYHYYCAVIALARLGSSLPPAEAPYSLAERREMLLKACSTIIELTNQIDIAPYTPIWMLLSAPLSAMFTLFDFVIHNPADDKTASNLSLLGIAAGYFCRLEYASGGALQTAVLSDIAHIARDYIHDVKNGITARMANPTYAPHTPRAEGAIRLGSQTPLSLPGGPTLSFELPQGQTTTGDLYNPGDDFQFLMGSRFPEGVDLDELFCRFSPAAHSYPFE